MTRDILQPQIKLRATGQRASTFEVPGAWTQHTWGIAVGALTLLFLAASAIPCAASAQTNPRPGRRYLMIVETSKAMDRRTAGLNQAVRELLNSGFHGEIRDGDSLGVWTFNEALFTGKLRLQRLSSRDNSMATTEILQFLKAQKYEKSAKWNPLLPGLKHLAENSPALTVILITAGLESVAGTPFDAKINKAFSSWREPQQSARMPLVTVLRARGGTLTDCAVSAAPWPTEFPALPPEPQVAAAPAPKPAPAQAATAAPAKPTAVLPPLIVSGRKPEPTPPRVLTTAAPVIQSSNAMASTPVPAPDPATSTTSGPTNLITAVAKAPEPTATALSAGSPAAAPGSDTEAAAPLVASQTRTRESTSPPNTPALATPEPAMAAPAAASSRVTPASSSATAPPLAIGPSLPAPGWVKFLWPAAAGAMILAIAAGFLVWKNSRRGSRISLITESLDQPAEHPAQIGDPHD